MLESNEKKSERNEREEKPDLEIVCHNEKDREQEENVDKRDKQVTQKDASVFN